MNEPAPPSDDTRRVDLLSEEVAMYRTERYRCSTIYELARDLHRFGVKAVITPCMPWSPVIEQSDPCVFRVDFEPLE
jgi:hypothetical protein